MTDSRSFRKLPECASEALRRIRCQFYTGSSFLFCTVHPLGIASDRCLDFQEDRERHWEHFLALDWGTMGENGTGEQWEPEGASYYNGELILTPEQRWSQEEQVDLLDWHPMFTGRCPECERPIAQTDPPRVHWDCSECGWKDDTV